MILALSAVTVLAADAACEEGTKPAPSEPKDDSPAAFTLTSTAFKDGKPIPVKYTGDGKNVSPPLAWAKPPEGTQQFALICDDPDAPRKDPWVHWVIYGLAADVSALPEALATGARLEKPLAALQGKNSSGSTAYRGPAPPKGHGVHHYHFKLYALKSKLELKPGLTKEELLKAMKDHVLAEAELVGTYERPE
ncbi:MAG: YbhB/YbcL family Raf kinase inhibitor-like protein [Planctomycetes bacterium]|nr:YbhB/YbcL family Raf kinase inhibitor-like protein [Planctomycetota bacterium]